MTADKIQVLIVDDLNYQVDVFRFLLRDLEVEVDVAMRGDEALARLLGKHYDAVFLDWHLPGMNGGEVSKRFRAQESGDHRTVLIATTGNSENENECMKCGMDLFLGKPLTEDGVKGILFGLFGADRLGASRKTY